MSLNYTKKTLDHFLKPKNIGKLDKPDGYAQIGNMVCGDQLDFYIKVKQGKIVDVKFLSFGCASNIATASVLTEKVKGMTLKDAKEYAWQTIVDELGGLPQQKIHCSVMAVQGLHQAILNYEKKNKAKSAPKKSSTATKVKIATNKKVKK